MDIYAYHGWVVFNKIKNEKPCYGHSTTMEKKISFVRFNYGNKLGDIRLVNRHGS
jgi:hypothetical protein